MNGQISSAEQAALTVGRMAILTPQTVQSVVDTVVLSLHEAGLLQDPAASAELARMQGERMETNAAVADQAEERARLLARVDELEPYEVLNPQTCENGQHLPWFVDLDVPVDCPWCRIAVLQAAAGRVYGALCGETRIGPPYMTREAAAAHCEAELRLRRPDAVCVWAQREADPSVIELSTQEHGHTSATGYSVASVTVAASFNPEHLAPTAEATS